MLKLSISDNLSISTQRAFIWCSLLIGLNSFSAAAQEKSLYRLEKINVSETQTDEMLKDEPVRTEVMTSKDFKVFKLRNAAEIVSTMTGVTLQNQIGKTGKTAVIQGFSNDRIAVLIDGIPVSINGSNGFDLAQVPSFDVKQVEVIKGSSNSSYGSQAMGGIINIVTKKNKKDSQQLSFDLNTETNQSTNLNLRFSGKKKKHTYKATIVGGSQESIDRNKESLAFDTPFIRRARGSFFYEYKLNEKFQPYVRFDQYLEENKINNSQGQPDGSFLRTEDTGEINNSQYVVGAKLNFSTLTNLHLFHSVNTIEDDFVLGDNPETSFKENVRASTLRQSHTEAKLVTSFSDDKILTIGSVYKTNFLDQTQLKTSLFSENETSEVDGKSNQSIEQFARLSFLLENSELVVGGRYINDQFFGDQFSPEVNFNYFSQVGQLDSQLRFSFSVGNRAPNLKERFYFLDHRAIANYIIEGNEDLVPEKTQSYQLSYSLLSKDNFQTDLSIFFHNVTDLINVGNSIVDGDNQVFTYSNVDNVNIYGLELSGKLLSIAKFVFSGNFSFTRAIDLNSGNQLADRPLYTSKVQLSYRGKKWTPAISYNYFGESYADVDNSEKYNSYILTNLRLNYTLDKSQLYFGVDNLFDAKRDAVADGAILNRDPRPSLGRAFMLGMTYEI